jgi:Fe-S-cluster-containing hydrogenase component 2
MKKLAVKNLEACRTCLSCEVACAQAFYKEEKFYQANLSCIHVTTKDDKLKIQVCLQCGKCAKTCEQEAISKNDKGVYVIDKKKCTNCGKCLEACPVGVMVKSASREFPSKCIACGICIKSCPQDVLYIKEDEKVAS